MKAKYNELRQNRNTSAGVKLLALLCVSSALSLSAVVCWTTTTAPCVVPGTSCTLYDPNCPPVPNGGYATNVPLLGAWTNSAAGYWNAPTTNQNCIYDCQMYPGAVNCRGERNIVGSATNSTAVPDTGTANSGCPGA
jgi:hypothetical protein